MKILLRGALALACLAVAGCQTTGPASLTSANNALAKLAANDLPTACAIVAVAEGYYTTLQPRISAKNQATAAKAIAAANSICTPPYPTNVASALGSLFSAWMAVQSATKAN